MEPVCGRCHKEKGKGPENCKCGHPLKFKTPAILQAAVDNYFESCWEEKPVKVGKKNVMDRVQVRPYTITGLAMSLDTNRESLLNYAERDGYKEIIESAKLKIHNFVEEYLFTGKNPHAAMFNLKNNYGWKDESTLNNKLTGALSLGEVIRKAKKEKEKPK